MSSALGWTAREIAAAVQRGEVVALIGRNRPGWVWGQLAAHCLGCSTLGLYEDVLAQIRTNVPFAHAPLPIQPADKAYENVLANAGATLPRPGVQEPVRTIRPSPASIPQLLANR